MSASNRQPNGFLLVLQHFYLQAELKLIIGIN